MTARVHNAPRLHALAATVVAALAATALVVGASARPLDSPGTQGFSANSTATRTLLDEPASTVLEYMDLFAPFQSREEAMAVVNRLLFVQPPPKGVVAAIIVPVGCHAVKTACTHARSRLSASRQ